MTIKVALDWVPNANHVGLFLAGLEMDVEFISPHSSSYGHTPQQLVRAGEADIGIGPSESVISSFIEHGQDGVVAIAALVVKDDSAIATLAKSGIDTMAKLDGKRYASYSARFEGRIVQSMIKHAGGSGVYQELSPEKLGVFDTARVEEGKKGKNTPRFTPRDNHSPTPTPTPTPTAPSICSCWMARMTPRGSFAIMRA